MYSELQKCISTISKIDILVIQDNWIAKLGIDSHAFCGRISGDYYSVSINERGNRLLDFAKYNNLIAANTCGSIP